MPNQKLAVYEKEGLPFLADSSRSTFDNDGFTLTAENIHHPDSQKKLRVKIGTALKLLTFREQPVLVQFWSSHVVGSDKLLTNIDQPYGLAIAANDDDEALLSFRKNPKCNDPDLDNDNNPLARVFRGRLPEWTSDLRNYLPNDFPQQKCAIKCNLHGYLALPVFDSAMAGMCVGVLEVLTSSRLLSFAYEVKQVHDALKKQNLTCQQAFDHPALNVPSDRKQNEWNKLLGILKELCDIHNLPLAQTWEAVSPSTNFASPDKIHETCSAFDTKCIGKVCMSTVSQALHVKDLGVWDFMEECEKIHLEKSKGVVGKASSFKGLYYCRDVTKLKEEDYPRRLAILAPTYNLSACFAIFLHSVENNDDYVLEFFLRSEKEHDGVIKDDRLTIEDVVQTLKEKIKASSGLEFSGTSFIQEVGLPSDSSDISN